MILKVLTYVLSTVLILVSLVDATANLRALVVYCSRLLRHPFAGILWQGLILGPVIMLSSIYVGVRALFDPSPLWLKIVIAFVVANVVATILR